MTLTFIDYLKADFKVNSGWKRKLALVGFRLKFYTHHFKRVKILNIFAKACSRIITYMVLYEIPPGTVFIGPGLRIPHGFETVFISNFAIIGSNVTIYHGVTIGEIDGENYKEGDIKIGDNVLIGAGAKIIGKCVIEDNVKIGANALVYKKRIEADSVVFVNSSIVKKYTA